MACAGTGLYDCRLSRQCDQSFSIQQPDQAGLVEAGKRPAVVAAEQIERGPTQGRSSFGKRAREEACRVGDKGLPAAWPDTLERAFDIETLDAAVPIFSLG